ncbi:type IV pilin protein [Variovorax sp. RHLX14]|uniref:type IV pilin protein n=1 Tax=Variovorax sp. RHLX14 TaxID=1259731 RepID=UPI003F48DB31
MPNHRNAKRPTSDGFTLIELLIVIAVLGILASTAFPSFSEFVRKGRRAGARNAIVEMLQQQERFMTQTGSYQKIQTAGMTGTSFKTYTGDSPGSASHLLAAGACGGTAPGAALPLTQCVRVSAEPQQSDPTVGMLWMDSTGAKDCDGTRKAEARLCWP